MLERTIDERLLREHADTYHGRSKDYLTSHALAAFRENPLLYRKKQLGLVAEPERTAFVIGRAAHTLVLEGREQYQREFAVGGPINPRTGNPYGSGTKAFAEWAERIGKPVLTDAQAAMIEEMNAAVQRHIFAAELLADGVAERVARCQYHGHRCQARFDWINPRPDRGIVDFKTCDSLSSFEFDISAYGYVHQLAFYREVLAVVIGHVLPVHIIAAEKREPYRCGVWHISRRSLDKAQKENEQAMDELTRCREQDIWPTRFESLRLYDRT